MSSQTAIDFIAGFSTATIATVSPEGEPLASYAPFIFSENKFYIFVSQLAAHTRNLTHSRLCHFMLIAEEANTNNLFARKRLSFYCDAAAIDRDSPDFPRQIELFRNRFGPVVSMLESLPDFIMIELTPRGTGNFVEGFGKASNVPLA